LSQNVKIVLATLRSMANTIRMGQGKLTYSLPANANVLSVSTA